MTIFEYHSTNMYGGRLYTARIWRNMYDVNVPSCVLNENVINNTFCL